MEFITLSFLFFIAVTTIIYFAVPRKVQWVVLLAASYLFFFFNSQWLVLILFVSTAVTYLTGISIAKIYEECDAYLNEHADLARKEKAACKDRYKKKAKKFLLAGVLFVLGMLLFLKYYNFFAENSNIILRHLGVTLPRLNLLLPIGISFYTLQAIAYMTDVYRRKYTADTHLMKFMLFMSFFPHIVQGPIARHDQLAEQLYQSHAPDYKRMKFGIQLILWGFMKKLILADLIAIPVNEVFNNYSDYNGMIVFLAAAGYGIQVYADFSSGMDIARGTAQIFGIDLTLNFEQPYFSSSIEEFWRRWHITLGSWMRDYVFYPLSLSKMAGNLSKKARKTLGNYIGKRLPAFIAMFIVFVLVGVWHGSEWKYVAYGIYNGIFITLGILLDEKYAAARDKFGIDADSHSWKAFQYVRSFAIISFGRFFSRGRSFLTALAMMKSSFVRWYDLSFFVDGTMESLGLDSAHWMLLIFALLVLLFVDVLHEKGVNIREEIAAQHVIFRWLIYGAALVVLLIFGIYGPCYESCEFIYEQF